MIARALVVAFGLLCLAGLGIMSLNWPMSRASDRVGNWGSLAFLVGAAGMILTGLIALIAAA